MGWDNVEQVETGRVDRRGRTARYGIRRIVLGVTLVGCLCFVIRNYASPTDLITSGGKADHRLGANGIDSGTDGTCTGTSFSSPTGNFSSADLNRIMVVTGDSQGTVGAGPGVWTNAPLFTTIKTVNSATSVTLSDPCSHAISGTAQWDVGTDNSAALQACVNAGTCTIPAGNFLFNHYVRIPSNTTLQCQAGATLFFPRHDGCNCFVAPTACPTACSSCPSATCPPMYTGNDPASPGAMSFLELNNVSNVSIQNCTIVGTDIHESFDVGNEFNYPIVISGNSTGNSILNNTIMHGWSDGEIMVDSIDTGIPTNNVISGNHVTSCGFNGIAVVTGNANIIENNTLTDCAFDIEPNSTANGPVFSNLVQGNVVQNVSRPGQAGTSWFVTDGFGSHWKDFFQGCASPACEDTSENPDGSAGTGGDSESIISNTFQGEVMLLPFCRSGSVSQTWTNNQTLSTAGQTCTLGTAGCGYVPSWSCAPPVTTGSASWQADSTVAPDLPTTLNSIIAD